MIASNDLVWQDREIRFDAKPNLLACRKGEKLIDSINSVEDTKGNNGERGSLIVTNLRILWISHANNNINLSIGMNCILSANIKKAKSKLRGDTQALCLLAKHQARYEFVFTSLVKNSPRLFTTIQAVMRAYETSKLYRDLKLRGSIVNNGELLILPMERQFSKINGVWNLSSDQGNLGSFFLTNVRIAWTANLANNFNVSVPYMQIKNIRLRDSKFGKALVIETHQRAGGYILGFKVDSEEKLNDMFREITNIYQTCSTSPIFGVDFVVESEAPSIQELLVARVEEDVEIIDDVEDAHAVAAYYADGNMNTDDIVIEYDPILGLAIESTGEDVTLENLWRVY